MKDQVQSEKKMIKLFVILLLCGLMLGCDDYHAVGSTEPSTLSYAFWGWAESQSCCPRVLLVCRNSGRTAVELEKSFEWHVDPIGSMKSGGAWYPNLADAKHAAEQITDTEKLCEPTR